MYRTSYVIFRKLMFPTHLQSQQQQLPITTPPRLHHNPQGADEHHRRLLLPPQNHSPSICYPTRWNMPPVWKTVSVVSGLQWIYPRWVQGKRIVHPACGNPWDFDTLLSSRR
jgi:hypothetical protein